VVEKAIITDHVTQKKKWINQSDQKDTEQNGATRNQNTSLSTKKKRPTPKTKPSSG
jgi:hypothetical protein